MVNVLGKVAIGDIPGQKASKQEVLTWKTSTAMLEAKFKLWKPVDLSEDADPCDTYICCIMTEVFRSRRSKLNQEFAIVVIDMMFDSTITTTSFTDGEIYSRIEALSKQVNNVQESNDNAEDNNDEQHLEEYENHSDCHSNISHSGTPSMCHNYDDNSYNDPKDY
ncbi:2972_t:CDS:2 [Dentiscutata erythropus]|uniref:2972_t:CDS:1 n=1 Tax=Dentiscutata erythropus TaxID=1348616 RepID=A0A9N8WGF6_9GLOM|nr:2972_t:CDS:2 [Dentiscutata erythropus]